MALVNLRQGSADLAAVVDEMIALTTGEQQLPEQVIALALLAGESFRLLQRELASRVLALLPIAFPEDLRGRPEGWVHVARATIALGHDLGEAADQAKAALLAFRSSGATRDVAMMLSFTGYVLFELGANEDAQAHYTEFLPLARQLGARQWLSNGEQNLGLIFLRRGEFAEAEKLLESAADGYAHVEMRSDQAVSLFWLALAKARRGELEASLEVIEQALEAGGSEPSALAGAHATLARIELLRGRAEAALRASETAMELIEAHQLFEHVAMMRTTHIDCLLACGREEDAHHAILDACEWLQSRVKNIADPQVRQAILSKVPEHAQIMALQPGTRTG
jgi:tetratricopeptide (TPR) repeat protein